MNILINFCKEKIIWLKPTLFINETAGSHLFIICWHFLMIRFFDMLLKKVINISKGVLM